VALGPYDTLSIPVGAWRSFQAVGNETTQAVVLTSSDSRVYIEWAENVVADALAAGVALDPNGYVAPAGMLNL
jgi:hypothetical protein